jgi:hypothetical protein
MQTIHYAKQSSMCMMKRCPVCIDLLDELEHLAIKWHNRK